MARDSSLEEVFIDLTHTDDETDVTSDEEERFITDEADEAAIQSDEEERYTWTGPFNASITI